MATLLSEEALRTLGTPTMVYIKLTLSDDIIREQPLQGEIYGPGELCYALRTADGTLLGVAEDRVTAWNAAIMNELLPMSVH